jgi:hypothetical protein
MLEANTACHRNESIADYRTAVGECLAAERDPLEQAHCSLRAAVQHQGRAMNPLIDTWSSLFHPSLVALRGRSENGTVSYRGNGMPVDLTIDGPGAMSFSVFFGGSEVPE